MRPWREAHERPSTFLLNYHRIYTAEYHDPSPQNSSISARSDQPLETAINKPKFIMLESVVPWTNPLSMFGAKGNKKVAACLSEFIMTVFVLFQIP